LPGREPLVARQTTELRLGSAGRGSVAAIHEPAAIRFWPLEEVIERDTVSPRWLAGLSTARLDAHDQVATPDLP